MSTTTTAAAATPPAKFDDLGLDHRIVKALLKAGFIEPTQVQIQAIPIGLQKKDILLRAQTGSGKTLAFTLPLLENLLRASSTSTSSPIQGPRALILAPTQELIQQIDAVLTQLTVFCNDSISHLALRQQGQHNLANEAPRLKEHPNILVCTPARLYSHLKANNVSLSFIEHIILDEADLMLTHDFESDIKHIVLQLPSNKQRAQIVLCSATLNPNTKTLQELFLMHHPCTIDPDNGNGFNAAKLTEYYLDCQDYNDKFLVMYALLKLNIVNGKCLVFTHSLNICYRLKLFLEKFLIPSAVLNPTLPYNSRQSVIDKFNRGLLTYLITTDDIKNHEKHKKTLKNLKKPEKLEKPEVDTEMVDKSQEYSFADDEEVDPEVTRLEKSIVSNDSAAKTHSTQARALCAHRGVDFREVAAVINFSAPNRLDRYIHRVGRTARAGHYGVAITLVTSREMKRFANVMRRRVSKDNTKESLIQKLPLKVHDLNSFRYRCESVRCSITPRLVQQARLNELRMEILNSKRLKSHFTERKREYELLRHDKMLQPAEMVKAHMSHVPTYMLNGSSLAGEDIGSTENGKKVSATRQYMHTFGQLPPVIQEARRKRKLRKRLQKNPVLRRAVYAARRRNLKHPMKRFDAKLLNNQGFLDKSTLLKNFHERGMRQDPKVHVEQIRGWKKPLQARLVKLGRRGPSFRGLAKGQIRKLKKRRKMKKMARRR